MRQLRAPHVAPPPPPSDPRAHRNLMEGRDLDLARVQFGRPGSGQELRPDDSDELNALLSKARRVGQIVLSGHSIADELGVLSRREGEASPSKEQQAPSAQSAELLARRSLPPIAWAQYRLFRRGVLVPPPILWTEPELSSAGFTPARVVAFTNTESETVLASKLAALDALYPPSSRAGRETVRNVHVLVFETTHKHLLPLLQAAAKIQELKRNDAGSVATERLLIEQTESEDLFRALSARLEAIKRTTRETEWQVEVLLSLARGRAQALLPLTGQTGCLPMHPGSASILPASQVEVLKAIMGEESSLMTERSPSPTSTGTEGSGALLLPPAAERDSLGLHGDSQWHTVLDSEADGQRTEEHDTNLLGDLPSASQIFNMPSEDTSRSQGPSLLTSRCVQSSARETTPPRSATKRRKRSERAERAQAADNAGARAFTPRSRSRITTATSTRAEETLTS